jgi:ectoine hydroxylase-related dioxygenase (phytanoyl-CoA dioxygenase family)
MSESYEEKPQPKPAPYAYETRQPFDFSDELKARVDALGLAETVQHAEAAGYGYIYDAAPIEFFERLKQAIYRTANGTAGPRGSSMLLTRDPVFVEAVLNPKLLTIVEILCGQGAMLSQLSSTIIPKQADEPRKGGLHADQNWTPAPFPRHNQTITLCWACTDYTHEGGATKVVPDSHLLRRHPTPDEVAEEAGVISTECPAGTIVFWNGSIWHGGGTRTIDGERVVLHTTFSRLAMRPIENYDALGEDWLADKPYEMRVLLGREDFLNKGGAVNHTDKIANTFNWAKT